MDLYDKFKFITNFGFTVVHHIHTTVNLWDAEYVKECIQKIVDWSQETAYPIDGVVFKYANCEFGRALGEQLIILEMLWHINFMMKHIKLI
jgi:NAD-dependent DNA ligase